ncbi:MAG: CaiB/BaiF CoA-transferase family protein [Pseudomonadota bacterium]
MPGPLDGIRIVDVSAVVSGPLATMMLANQGADVIKIEPAEGDVTRLPANIRAGMPAFYANCNRGKRSISLDLKHDAGRAIVLDLVKEADVFVQNWRPGAAEELGLGEKDLHALNPDLIYTSISGYGESGPLRHQRVYDPIIQALTGYISAQKDPRAPAPDLVRNIEVDKATSLMAAQAITAALYARKCGAGGQSIHVPMLDVGLWFLFPDCGAKHTFIGEGMEVPISTTDAYRLWETSDGYIVFFTASVAQGNALAEALGHPEWMEEVRFQLPEVLKAENRLALNELIEVAIKQFSTAEVIDRMQSAEVSAAPVLAFDEVLEHEQIKHNGIIIEQEHPVFGRYRAVRPAAKFSATPQTLGSEPAFLGEHSDDVLAEMGYDEAKIAQLREQGIVH